MQHKEQVDTREEGKESGAGQRSVKSSSSTPRSESFCRVEWKGWRRKARGQATATGETAQGAASLRRAPNACSCTLRPLPMR
jgi:hypothetical protein